MKSAAEQWGLPPADRAVYASVFLKGLAHDAVVKLWERRKKDGLKQKDLARKIGRNPGWVSRLFSGPRNWTLHSLAELVEAMDGRIQIIVAGKEDRDLAMPNFDAYQPYSRPASRRTIISTGGARVTVSMPASVPANSTFTTPRHVTN